MTINPTPPQSLNAFAREILDLLAGHPDADDITGGTDHDGEAPPFV